MELQYFMRLLHQSIMEWEMYILFGLVVLNNLCMNAYPVDALQLTGSVNVTAGTSTVNGTNTGFLSDLKLGDLIEVQDVGSASSS